MFQSNLFCFFSADITAGRSCGRGGFRSNGDRTIIYRGIVSQGICKLFGRKIGDAIIGKRIKGIIVLFQGKVDTVYFYGCGCILFCSNAAINGSSTNGSGCENHQVISKFFHKVHPFCIVVGVSVCWFVFKVL